MADYKYYKLGDGSIAPGILRTTDNAYIPANVNNKDWIVYQEWLAVPGANNTPDPA